MTPVKKQPSPFLLIFLSVAFTAIVTASTSFIRSTNSIDKKVIVIEEKVKECAERQAVINIYTDKKLDQLQETMEQMRIEQREDMKLLREFINKKLDK
jgi:hypothetical protein